MYYVFDAANELSTRISDEISTAARGNWRKEVDEFVTVMGRKFGTPASLRLILEQATAERHPSQQYVERESVAMA